MSDAPGQPPPSRVRRALRFALLALLLAESSLQIARPKVLDDLRQRTLPYAGEDSDYITLQSLNFDPATRQPLLVDDAELFWRPLPDRQGDWFLTDDVRTNELAMRDPPFEPRASEAEVRILFLGDSVTFGMRVTEEERFSNQFVDRLWMDDAEMAYTIVNAGVIGYAASQALACLPAWIEAAQPDLVVWALGLNDCLLLPASDAEFRAQTTSGVESLRRGLRGSQLVCGAELAWAGLRREVDELANGRRRALARWVHWPRMPPGGARVPRTSEEEYFAALERAEALCREAGAELVLVTPWASADVPSVRTPDAAYFQRLAHLAASLREWGGRRGLIVADARTALEFSGRLPRDLLLDFCHPTPAGHAIIAAEMHRALRKAGLPGRWQARAGRG